jgi:hypothetical protein
MDVMRKAIWSFAVCSLLCSSVPMNSASVAFAPEQRGASCTVSNGGSLVYLPNALTKRSVAAVGSGSCTGTNGGIVTVEVLDNGRVVSSATRRCATSRGRACQTSTTYIPIVKGRAYSARVTVLGAV